MTRRLAAAASVFALGLPVLAGAVEVAPHRALYGLALETAKPQSRVVGATGSLGYEWGETCDGWTIEQRYKLDMQYDEDPAAEIGSTFVTWESKDGLKYRFNERCSTSPRHRASSCRPGRCFRPRTRCC